MSRKRELMALVLSVTILAGCEKIRESIAKSEPVLLLRVTLKALAGNEDYPAGELHAALLFSRADEADIALSRCQTALKSGGWEAVYLHQSGAVDPERLAGLEDDHRWAYRRAQREDCSVLVFEDPVDPTELGG